jgi:hypothetical protein
VKKILKGLCRRFSKAIKRTWSLFGTTAGDCDLCHHFSEQLNALGRFSGLVPIITPTQLVGGTLDIFSPESHQRSWWIVHTWPTTETAAGLIPNPTNAVGGSFIFGLQRRLRLDCSRIPPTQLVDRSYPAYNGDCGWTDPNPTNAVGGSFILGLQQQAIAEFHQRTLARFRRRSGSLFFRLCMNEPPTALVGFERAGCACPL